MLSFGNCPDIFYQDCSDDHSYCLKYQSKNKHLIPCVQSSSYIPVVKVNTKEVIKSEYKPKRFY